MVQRLISRANLPLGLAAGFWSAILYAVASLLFKFPYLPGVWGIVLASTGVSVVVCLVSGNIHERLLIISIPLVAGTTSVVYGALLNGGVLTIVIDSLALVIGFLLGIAWRRIPGRIHGRIFKILAVMCEIFVVILLIYGDLTFPTMQNFGARFIIAISLMVSMATTIETISRRPV